MRIYLDTQAMSLSDIYIVRLVVAKDYRNASAYQSQFFFPLFAECFPLSGCYLPVCPYELRVRIEPSFFGSQPSFVQVSQGIS